MRQMEKLQLTAKYNIESVRKDFDEACDKVALKYNLFYGNGKSRRAQIIETLTKTPCTSCLDKMLRKTSTNAIDNFYTQCHILTCNILVEELYSRLIDRGYTVSLTTENDVGGYGKIDVLLIPNHHGVDLYFDKKEVAIEVKTGQSFAFSQVLRYLLDNERRTILLWRIKNRQILYFEGPKLKPLTTQFMKMVISRAERLLSKKETSCAHHLAERNWSPSQERLQEALSDFSKGIMETLPSVVEAIIAILSKEESSDVENCKI